MISTSGEEEALNDEGNEGLPSISMVNSEAFFLPSSSLIIFVVTIINPNFACSSTDGTCATAGTLFTSNCCAKTIIGNEAMIKNDKNKITKLKLNTIFI